MESLDSSFVFRLSMFIGTVIYGVGLLANIVETLDTFNPSYLRYYLRQQCLRPLLGMVVFTLLLLAEPKIASWLAN
jgi:hypothetical protein